MSYHVSATRPAPSKTTSGYFDVAPSSRLTRSRRTPAASTRATYNSLDFVEVAASNTTHVSGPLKSRLTFHVVFDAGPTRVRGPCSVPSSLHEPTHTYSVSSPSA